MMRATLHEAEIIDLPALPLRNDILIHGFHASEAQHPQNLSILTLDGGGAKGFYTLGALREVEALAGRSSARSST